MGLMSLPAYVKYTGLTILFLLATVNFTRTTLDVVESSKRLDEVRGEVAVLEEEKQTLETELDYKKSVEYIEKEARNKLGFVKPGEQVFVTSEVLGSTAHNAFGTRTAEINVFRMWLDLFL